ncbi:F-box domain protein [Aspergillus heterothallicus]
MTQLQPSIEDLADELIIEILDFLIGADQPSNSSSPVNPHDRLPRVDGPSYARSESTELDRFRLVCKRFSRISTPRKFARFDLRFGRDDFRRLEELLGMQLACHVKYFTYMVRPFYKGSGWSQFFDGIDPERFQTNKGRLQDQTRILEENQDQEMLLKAIGAFSSLQQVKLLRLQDIHDKGLLDRIHESSLEEALTLDWESACTRAVTNLAISLLASNCTSVRFVGPQISPEATGRLVQTPSATLSALGARLACLDVTFYSGFDITSHMEALSDVFHDFFLAAENLTTIHLGFEAPVPLDLRLDQVFHYTSWEKLRTLSIQGWRLDSEEVIALIRRHRRHLRDVRLDRIYLRHGSRWRDVLSVLHGEMDEIERIDLRRINYANYLDGGPALNGANGHGNGHGTGIGTGNGNGHGSGSTGFYRPPHPLSVIVNHNTTSNPPLPPTSLLPAPKAVLNSDYLPSGSRGHTRSSSIYDLETLRKYSADVLEDNGICVGPEQIPLWEAWVLASPRNLAQRKRA